MQPNEVRQLILELFNGKYTKNFTQEDVERVLSQKNVYPFCHYECGGLVSIVMLYVVELFSRKVGVIEEVVTLSGYRGRGIASQLIKQAILKATASGCNCVELTVNEDKPDVQHFYRTLGFHDRHNRAMRLWIHK